MKGLRKNWLLGLVAILGALFLVAVACSDDETSNTELLAQFCGDLEALGVTLEQVQGINLDSTVGELRTAKDDVNKAVDNVKSSAGDIASVSGLESAYENLESAVDDVSEDATISEALSSIESAVQGVVDSRNETAEAVECTAPEATATTGPTEAAPTDEAPASGSIDITGLEYQYQIPASIAGGVTSVNFSNVGGEDHQATFFKLNDGVTYDDFAAALPTTGNEAAAEEFGTWAGGPGTGPGGTANNTLDLAAGQYAVLCLIPDAEGTIHAALGMIVPLEVTEPGEEQADVPESNASASASDFEFDAPDSLSAGENTFSFTNNGPQAHEMVIVKNGDGLSSEDLIGIVTAPPDPDAPPPEGPPPFSLIGQVAPMSNGGSATATINLEAGAYTYVCFVLDPETEAPHAALGMWKELTVE